MISTLRYIESRMSILQILIFKSNIKGEMRNNMQDYYNDEFLKHLITSTIQTVGMDNELKQDESGVNMTYNFISNTVGFDAKRLVEAWKEMDGAIPLEQYVKTLTMHELGHSMDREALQKSLDRTLEIMEVKGNYSDFELYTNEHLLSLIIEEHEMNIVFEETAWQNAKKINEKVQMVDEITFEIIKNQGLATYKNLYEEDLAIYQRVKEKSLQTV